MGKCEIARGLNFAYLIRVDKGSLHIRNRTKLHPERSMIRFLALIFAVQLGGVLFGAAAPFSASAQEFNIAVTELSGPIGTRTTIDEINRGVNLLDCESDSSYLQFGLLSGGSTAVASIDVWLGIGSETCVTAASRTPPSEVCRHLGHVQVGTSLGQIDDPPPNAIRIPMSEFRDAGEFCEFGNAPTTVNFLLVSGHQTYRGETSALDPSEWKTIPVRVDAGPPNSPRVSATDVSGNRDIRLSWERVTAGSEDIRYRVYVIADGCEGSESGPLVPGDRPPLELDGFYMFDVGPAVSYSIDGEDIGLEVGESASAFITSRDVALNESDLSERICVHRIATAGFCDAWAAAEGEECPTACSAVGASPRSVLWTALALTLLGFVMHARRRFAQRFAQRYARRLAR